MLRLDKFLANNAGLSRSEARAAIKDGIVSVNGDTVKAIATKVKGTDEILILKEKIELTGEIYLAFHKPLEVICATKHEEHETVLDWIPDYDNEPLLIAGRLDKDTTGLVLLSTDGKWIHKVTSPNYACKKVYILETAAPINPSLVERFEQGILLKDSDKLTAPATLNLISEKTASLTLTEGRYHQVRRMFGACGNKVVALHRAAVGEVDLDDLEVGKYRELSPVEVASFAQKQ